MITHDQKRVLLKDLQAGKLTREEFTQKVAGDNDVEHVIDIYIPQRDGTLLHVDTGKVLAQAEYDALPGHKLTFNLDA